MQKALHTLVVGGLAAISLFTLSSCTTSATGRHQLILVSKDQEMKLGLTAFDEMKKTVPISKDAKHNALVAKVGARIAEQAKGELPDAKWEFVVFDSKEANAFCLPGGKVGVYSGILAITQTEAGLATVTGHEVAHTSQHHGNERMSDAMAVQAVTQVAGSQVSDKYQAAAMTTFGVVGKYGVELPFSRVQESEADRVGLRYMAQAGYDPEEAVRFWQRFSEANKGQPSQPEFLRTHPLDSRRIADLQKWMPEAKARMKPAQ